MTGSGPLWRKDNPLAAPSAILILLDHGRGIFPSKIWEISVFSITQTMEEETNINKHHGTSTYMY